MLLCVRASPTAPPSPRHWFSQRSNIVKNIVRSCPRGYKCGSQIETMISSFPNAKKQLEALGWLLALLTIPSSKYSPGCSDKPYIAQSDCRAHRQPSISVPDYHVDKPIHLTCQGICHRDLLRQSHWGVTYQQHRQPTAAGDREGRGAGLRVEFQRQRR